MSGIDGRNGADEGPTEYDELVAEYEEVKAEYAEAHGRIAGISGSIVSLLEPSSGSNLAELARIRGIEAPDELRKIIGLLRQKIAAADNVESCMRTVRDGVAGVKIVFDKKEEAVRKRFRKRVRTTHPSSRPRSGSAPNRMPNVPKIRR